MVMFRFFVSSGEGRGSINLLESNKALHCLSTTPPYLTLSTHTHTHTHSSLLFPRCTVVFVRLGMMSRNRVQR